MVVSFGVGRQIQRHNHLPLNLYALAASSGWRIHGRPVNFSIADSWLSQISIRALGRGLERM